MGKQCDHGRCADQCRERDHRWETVAPTCQRAATVVTRLTQNRRRNKETHFVFSVSSLCSILSFFRVNSFAVSVSFLWGDTLLDPLLSVRTQFLLVSLSRSNIWNGGSSRWVLCTEPEEMRVKIMNTYIGNKKSPTIWRRKKIKTLL